MPLNGQLAAVGVLLIRKHVRDMNRRLQLLEVRGRAQPVEGILPSRLLSP